MAALTRHAAAPVQWRQCCCSAPAAPLSGSSSTLPTQRTALLRCSCTTSCLPAARQAPPSQLLRLVPPAQEAHRRVDVCAARLSSEEGAGQELGLLLTEASAEELEADRQWIARAIAAWLDEEWTPLDVHTQLGEAAGAAYVASRQAGDNDLSSLVLGLSNELLAFNYRETFVNAFEVANKVVEMIMLRDGREVCCSTDEDAERVRRLS